jgi:hypothetical protein
MGMHKMLFGRRTVKMCLIYMLLKRITFAYIYVFLFRMVVMISFVQESTTSIQIQVIYSLKNAFLGKMNGLSQQARAPLFKCGKISVSFCGRNCRHLFFVETVDGKRRCCLFLVD